MNYWTRFIKYCQRPDMIKLHALNPGLTMVELSRGAKAGGVFGVISGAVHTPLAILLSWVIARLTFRSIAPAHDFERYVADAFLSPNFLSNTISKIIFGAITGLLFGSLFIVLYDKLPGKTPTMKGIATAISYWAALWLGIPLIAYLSTGYYDNMVSYFTNINHGGPVIMVGLGTSLLWGWLLGRLWIRDQLGKR